VNVPAVVNLGVICFVLSVREWSYINQIFFFCLFQYPLYSYLLILSVVQICRSQAQIFFWICWLTNCLTSFNCQEGPWQFILSTN